MSHTPTQPDLFGPPDLAGLSQGDAIVTPGKEQELIASIDAIELSPFRFHGWLGKRLTAMFGWRYDFDDASFTPAEAIPDWLRCCGPRLQCLPAWNRANSRRRC